ncbi:MAG: hypothetical protein UY61_C0018G0007 [Candidatus Adlerbacteria bacterium GW2011_GWC1_50_9]|uniref:Homing endonuclease LAGLIDADG domain-containing protein n=1 Tax=Candidatus Adlerbacteria bacterium GW2011_GWC1_50_9 TaxID=1618608 RepID=A0A0G1WQ97_9BACT|nr:MAG: hypothetical protein UY61_C0018G0007 [Candidatus Adlerbacteria bacterium GW2011_GWC1_50_9]
MTKFLTKESLKKLYVTKRLSTWAIERRLGISRSRIYVSLKRYGIAPRNLAQSHVQYSRSDFSGNVCEKAYLLGFAIGDLRVRKHNKGSVSDTISIACGSTKLAQIQLIERLFSRYGRVWKGKPDKRGAINIEAFVNRTFSFLLPEIRDYRWCVKDRKHFFAFVAGFTDAEGSFFISRNQARVSWGNYDEDVLAYIQHGLREFGIQTANISHDRLTGYVGTHGYKRNKNYYHLHCSRKEAIRHVILQLGPYLKHADKKRAAERIKVNLRARGVSV